MRNERLSDRLRVKDYSILTACLWQCATMVHGRAGRDAKQTNRDLWDRTLLTFRISKKGWQMGPDL